MQISDEDRKTVREIKARLRSGYSRIIEGVNTWDNAQMCDDIRTLLKEIESLNIRLNGCNCS